MIEDVRGDSCETSRKLPDVDNIRRHRWTSLSADLSGMLLEADTKFFQIFLSYRKFCSIPHRVSEKNGPGLAYCNFDITATI